MLNHNQKSAVFEELTKPLAPLIAQCDHQRSCPVLDDEQWVHTGLRRMLSLERSGRGFLQQLIQCSRLPVTHSNFFRMLNSPRRLGLIEELNTRLVSELNQTLSDCLANYPSLNPYDIYAGDGHYRAASTHETSVADKKYAVGHFYTLNLRTHTLTHLDSSLIEPKRKKEHDMHLLKRLAISQLRQGAPKGRRVLYVWDRKDPLNRGVIADEWVSTSKGVYVRRVTYRCPRSSETFSFITNAMDIAPGLIAHLYKLRWNIEKVYDQLKTKLEEKKAWGKSNCARNTQALFTCLIHNLMVHLEQLLDQNEGISDTREQTRRQARLNRIHKEITEKGCQIPRTLNDTLPPTQRSHKFIRWLRNHQWYSTS